MQYYLDNGEHDIIVKQPHGNSKRNARPHRRSKESLKEKKKTLSTVQKIQYINC